MNSNESLRTLTEFEASRRKIRKQLKHPFLYNCARSMYNFYCNFSGPLHKYPDYLIIGASRSGTTSLFEYLIRHPNVEDPTTKQIHYFDKYYVRGKNWYKNHFPLKWKKGISGDATPYYYNSPDAAKRIQNLIPSVKIIMMCRNPVDRAYSHYFYEFYGRNETLSFEDAIEKEGERIQDEFERMESDANFYSEKYYKNSYLDSGKYEKHLQKWLTHFPTSQFLFIKSEDFYKSTSEIFSEIQKFLNIPQSDLPEYKIFRAEKYPDMEQKLRKKLEEYFKPYNEKFYKLIGKNFGW
jgi:hypothetical protein